MRNCTTESVEADFDWCYDIVGEVSRTFALTIAELDEPIAREICVGYLLCRVADTIEDTERIPADEQTRLLELYHDALGPDDTESANQFAQAVEPWLPSSPSADWQVVAEAERVLRAFAALSPESRAEIRPAVQEMIEGMVMFIDRYADEGGLRIETVDELEEYCWYVAGTVGHLVTGLVARDSPPPQRDILYETADSFGLLLQLVNIAKDVSVDYTEENNVYTPTEILQTHGLEHADIADTDQSDAFEPVVRDLVSKAEQYTDEAHLWLDSMPRARGNTLSAWAIPYLLAIGTIRELKRRPVDVLTEGTVKISREEVYALLSEFAGETDPSLERMQDEIRAGSLGQ